MSEDAGGTAWLSAHEWGTITRTAVSYHALQVVGLLARLSPACPTPLRNRLSGVILDMAEGRVRGSAAGG